MEKSELNQKIANLLFKDGRISLQEQESFHKYVTLENISADGSLREFFRVSNGNDSICVGVVPHAALPQELAESHAAVAIGRHLWRKKIPVPDIIGHDPKSGLILYEDCGKSHLHDLLEKKRKSNKLNQDEIFRWYRPLIEHLVEMQVKGCEDFDTEWCYDTPVYDKNLMVERESEYFLNAFWYSFLQGRKYQEIATEFQEIAEHAEKGLGNYFLHRDFQSRNIMVKDDCLKIIDFQGGRLGPPGYDLASVLIDPYVNLEEEVQESLFYYYLKVLKRYIEIDESEFHRQYCYLKLQRNLQIVAAFSFLYEQRCKPFFKTFIKPAFEQLCNLLQEQEFSSYTNLNRLVNEARTLIQQKI